MNSISGNLAGIQFILSDHEYLMSVEPRMDQYQLQPLGQIAEFGAVECESVELSGQVNKVKAYYNEENGIVGITYFSDF